VHIRLHGGASWLYNLFMGAVERPLRDNIQRKVCEAAESAINTDAARELATLPVKVNACPRYMDTIHIIIIIIVIIIDIFKVA